MAQANLPVDQRGNPIQSLAPLSAPVVLALTGASQRFAVPAGADIVEISATGTCRFAFGDSNVNATASSSLFISGAAVYKVPAGASHIAFINYSGSTGDVTVTGLV